MLRAAQGFVPIVTSEAGSCLTAANWQEVGIHVASYSLDSLLLKPGLSLLKQISDIKSYLGWPGSLIINAMNLIVNKGIFSITSPYDGSKLKLSHIELVEIFNHLKPDAVVLPKKIIKDFPQIWDNWPESVIPFVHYTDLQEHDVQRPHGVYFNVNNVSAHEIMNQLERWSHLPRYIAGDMNPAIIKELSVLGAEYIESDSPAKDAIQGIVYHQKGEVVLTNPDSELQMETIDSQCSCPTCAQKLTKAYLHHLLIHTPLLCHRFLIQHNVYWVNTAILNLEFIS